MASNIREMGGYDYEFVDTNLPDEFQCPICTLVPRDVHQASCCGKMFCKSCLDELKRTYTRHTCPNCRTNLTNNHFFPDVNTNRKIRNLHIYCTNKDKKCLWKGSLRDINNHLSTCPFQMVECSNKCGTQLERHNLENHFVNNCLKRIVTCVYCHKQDEYQIINGDHYDECPNYFLRCPNNGCEEKLKQRLMTQHRTVCPHEIVMCWNGCGFKGKRNKLYKHLHNTCPKGIVSCVYCHKEDEYQIINGDHYKECPDFPLHCPNNGCERKIKRCLVTQHRHTCPKEEVDCQYSYMLYECKQKINKEDTHPDIIEHYKNEITLLRRITLVVTLVLVAVLLLSLQVPTILLMIYFTLVAILLYFKY